MSDDFEYDPDDELGQVEAAEVPAVPDDVTDEYIKDPNYDPANDALDEGHVYYGDGGTE